MSLIEVSPGIIRLEENEFMLLDEEDKEYPPDYYLAFDGELFETYIDFLKYIKKIVIECAPINVTKQFLIKETLSVGGLEVDYFQMRFDEYTLNLKIPPKSDILNIEREYINLTFWRGMQIVIKEQPIFKFSEIKFRLKGLFGW